MEGKKSFKDVCAEYAPRWLFGKGDISVHSRDGAGDTLLHHACRYGDLESARILIDAGADVNATGEHGATPLHMAAKNGTSPELVRYLLEKGAFIEARDANNDRPIHLAIPLKDSVVQLLVDAGVDVNAKGALGMTALHIAAAEGSELTVGLLLENGAFMQESEAGELPLDLAERKLDIYRRIRDELRKIDDTT